MRPGFLDGTDYWFGDLPKTTTPISGRGWRRSSSRPSDVHLYYAPQTEIPWYKQFWVEESVEEKYWD